MPHVAHSEKARNFNAACSCSSVFSGPALGPVPPSSPKGSWILEPPLKVPEPPQDRSISSFTLRLQGLFFNKAFGPKIILCRAFGLF